MAGGHIGGPGIHGGLQALRPVRDGPDPVVRPVPGDRPAGVAVPEFLERSPLVRVGLAAVLGEVVDGIGVASDEGGEGAPGTD